MHDDDFISTLLDAAASITRRLDRSLGAIKGISFSEYQMLSALDRAPSTSSTRVDLANAVGLTPSGVTRALRPLEKLGFIETVKDTRDARKSLAKLTPAGMELVSDARGVVADTVDPSTTMFEALAVDEQDRLVGVLRALAGE